MAKDLYTELSIIDKKQREIYFQRTEADEDQQIILDIKNDQISFSFSTALPKKGYASKKITIGKDFIDIEKKNYKEAELINEEKHHFGILNNKLMWRYDAEIDGKKHKVNGIAKVTPIFNTFCFDGLQLTDNIDTKKLAKLNFAEITTDHHTNQSPSGVARVLSNNQKKFLQGFFSSPVLPIADAWDMYQKFHPEKLMPLKKLRND